jgi:hypothetical protein
MAKGSGTDRKLVRNLEAIRRLDSDNISMTAINKQITKDRRKIPAALGTGYDSTAVGSARGGGAAITSPLSEPNAGTRAYYPNPRIVQSTDGVFTLELRDLKVIDMEDGKGAVVQFIFAQPS